MGTVTLDATGRSSSPSVTGVAGHKGRVTGRCKMIVSGLSRSESCSRLRL